MKENETTKVKEAQLKITKINEEWVKYTYRDIKITNVYQKRYLYHR